MTAEESYERGRACADRGPVAEAFECFERAIELRPDYADAYAARGDLWLELGYKSKAAEDYAKALEVAPPNWPHRLIVERKRDALKPPPDKPAS